MPKVYIYLVNISINVISLMPHAYLQVLPLVIIIIIIIISE